MFSELFDSVRKITCQEEVVPYSKRSPEDKKKIEDYDKEMTTAGWKEEYDEGQDRHWMEGEEPCPLAKELVNELEKAGIDRADILEIGIGNGRDSLFMSGKGHNVVGIDIAEEPVRTAQGKAESEKIEGVKFEVGDAEKLKYADNSFDAVYSVAAIHSTPLDSVFKEIYRVLKPEGIVKLFLYTKMRTGTKWMKYWPSSKIKQFAKGEGFEVKKFREGHRKDAMTIPGVEGEVEQENHFAVLTLKKKEEE